MILLDTSAAIALMAGKEPPAGCRIKAVGLSTIVTTELWRGVFHSGSQKERHKVEELLGAAEIFPFDQEAGERAAKIFAELWAKGEPIGDLDTLIGGHALSLRMPLLTGNDRHFSRIPDLEVIGWAL